MDNIKIGLNKTDFYAYCNLEPLVGAVLTNNGMELIVIEVAEIRNHLFKLKLVFRHPIFFIYSFYRGDWLNSSGKVYKLDFKVYTSDILLDTYFTHPHIKDPTKSSDLIPNREQNIRTKTLTLEEMEYDINGGISDEDFIKKYDVPFEELYVKKEPNKKRSKVYMILNLIWNETTLYSIIRILKKK